MFAFQCTTWRSGLAWATAGTVLLIDGYRLTYGQWKRGPHRCSVEAVRHKGNDVSGYLATYVLPFLVGPPATWHQAAAYLVYFAVAWTVFVNSDLLFINPTLYLLRWRVAAGRVNGREVLILAREIPKDSEEFDAVSFAGGIVRADR
jgi:hypothetical protein